MFNEMTNEELMNVDGGDLEKLGYAAGVALGAAGTVVAVAAIPITGGTSAPGALVAAGTAAYSWGQLVG